MMKLLRRHRQPKRSSEVQTVVVAGEHHVAALGKRIDLRTGETTPSKAALFGRDGAWVEWAKTGELFLLTPSGERTQLTGFEGLSTGVRMVCDEVVLLQADGRQPLLCIDRKSGKPTGRFEEMRGEPYAQIRLYNAHVFDPRDGRTVWLSEGGRVVQYDLATRRPLKVFEPQPGEKFLGLVVHPAGYVLTTARQEAAGFDTSRDEVVLFHVDRGQLSRRPLIMMSGAPLGDGFVVFEPAAKRFVFLDLELKEHGALAHDSNWAQLVALPSLREWITIGGHGEWDHHGEDGLGAPLSAEGEPPVSSTKKKASAAPRRPAKK
jgi:hypothetical protein